MKRWIWVAFFLMVSGSERTIVALDSSKNADLVVFSFDRPLQLEALLRSITLLVTGLDRITVIYRTSSKEFEKGYERVKKDFSHVFFVQQSSTHPRDDFKSLTMKAVFDAPSLYIIFAVDDMIVKGSVSMYDCINALEHYDAYGFYLRLGEHVDYSYMLNAYQGIPSFVEKRNDICVWQFSAGAYDWRYPTTLDMTLYRKADLRAVFNALSFNTPNSLETVWLRHACPDLNRLGLCYRESKVLNIPINQVMQDFVGSRYMGLFTPKELLDKFNQNLRMNIQSLMGMRNRSAHIEWQPIFYRIEA